MVRENAERRRYTKVWRSYVKKKILLPEKVERVLNSLNSPLLISFAFLSCKLKTKRIYFGCAHRITSFIDAENTLAGLMN